MPDLVKCKKPLWAGCPFPLEKSQLSTRKFESRMLKKERGLTMVYAQDSKSVGNTKRHTVTLHVDYSNSLPGRMPGLAGVNLGCLAIRVVSSTTSGGLWVSWCHLCISAILAQRRYRLRHLTVRSRVGHFLVHHHHRFHLRSLGVARATGFPKADSMATTTAESYYCYKNFLHWYNLYFKLYIKRIHESHFSGSA